MAWILSFKVLVISTGVLFTALGLAVSVPIILQHVPVMWSFCLLCFKPPYLYIIVNGIIICIVASSRFHHTTADADEPSPPPNAPVVPANYEVKSLPLVTISEPPVVYEPREEPQVMEVKAVMVNGSEVVDEGDEKGVDDGMESTRTPLNRVDSPEIRLDHLLSPEKPLVSARFGHRKPPKTSPDGGRSLRVAKPKRHETLENTWKAITEGRAMPLSRHMKKSDTWEHRGSVGPREATAVKGSENFKDRTNQPATSSSTMKLRKELSLTQDELNRRVEAFIQKFNEEMRLQRQESWNQFMETINRGSH
ncbi:uncharacterized protein LOC129307107 [Prosopis cineraria]|uniref:uncharacterized protein LOC129307107 n=1 Tax=Prosopis cineraria TaxID=364024 RepID=UPI00240ED318|nr:uncharacterized protein LOC129307107 [Prosopis cineraria]